MKKSLFFVSYFLLVFALFAQQDSTECSTIVLENNSEIPALINYVQSGILFYHKCPDSTGLRYSIPVNIIKFIREPNGRTSSPSENITNLPDIESTKKKDKPLNKFNNWVFKEKTGNKVIIITQEQYLKVVYVDSANKKQKVKGKWETLTDLDLILSKQNKSSINIPKTDIVKIVVFKKNKGLGKVLKIVLWSALGVISLISLLVAIKEADQKNTANPILGSLLITIFAAVIIGGIAAIIFAINTKPINAPFKGEWEITAPANKFNNVREIYKQP